MQSENQTYFRSFCCYIFKSLTDNKTPSSIITELFILRSLKSLDFTQNLRQLKSSYFGRFLMYQMISLRSFIAILALVFELLQLTKWCIFWEAIALGQKLKASCNNLQKNRSDFIWSLSIIKWNVFVSCNKSKIEKCTKWRTTFSSCNDFMCM